MFSLIRQWWVWTKWKWRAHRRRSPRLLIGHLPQFFKALNDAKVSYVVLRWFEEIPLTEDDEKNYHGDLDILVDSKDFRTFAKIVANHPGKIKIDLYSEGVQMATGYARLPYYPPPKAYELLDNRELYADTFYVPTPLFHLRSLCYHLCYHKGMLSGLDDGISQEHNPAKSSHDIQRTLRSLERQTGVALPEELTLFNLHQWLVSQDWNMPYDLLAHWGKKNQWHLALQAWLEEQLGAQRGDMRDILVFLIRQDAVDKQACELIMQRLKEHFAIVDTVQLSEAQKQRVMKQTRGADWTLHKSKKIVAPVIAVICHDPHPEPISGDSPLAKVHFNVKNAHVFYKQDLRAELEQRFAGAGNFLHGSDNDMEGTEYMLAIYGEQQMPPARERFLNVQNARTERM